MVTVSVDISNNKSIKKFKTFFFLVAFTNILNIFIKLDGKKKKWHVLYDLYIKPCHGKIEFPKITNYLCVIGVALAQWQDIGFTIGR